MWPAGARIFLRVTGPGQLHWFPLNSGIQKVSDLRALCHKIPTLCLVKAYRDPRVLSFAFKGAPLSEPTLLSRLDGIVVTTDVRDPPCIDVVRHPEREYEFQFDRFAKRQSFHEQATVRDCRIRWSQTLSVPYLAIEVRDSTRPAPDDGQLLSKIARGSKIECKLAAPYVVIDVYDRLHRKTFPFVIGANLYVVDLMSMIHLFRQEMNEPLCELRLWIGSCELKPEEPLAQYKSQLGNRDTKVHIDVGPPIPNELVDLPCEIEGQKAMYQFPKAVTLSYVRASFANDYNVGAHDVAFVSGSDRRTLKPHDPLMTVEAVLRQSPLGVIITCPKLTVRFGKDGSAEIFAISRVFDLKKKIANWLGQRFSNLQLQLDGNLLDDETNLGDLGLYTNIRIPYTVINPGICRLYFQNLDEERVILDFSDTNDIKFAALCARFHPTPSLVRFRFCDQDVPLTDPVNSVKCSPDIPIEVCMQTAVLKYRCSHPLPGIYLLDISSDTRASDAIATIRDRVGRGYRLSLWEGNLCLTDELLVGRNLDQVFELKAEHAVPEREIVVYVVALKKKKPTRTTYTFHGGAKVKDLRDALATDPKKKAGQIAIFLKDNVLCSDSDALLNGGEYRAEKRKTTQTFGLELRVREREPGKLRLSVTVDLDKVKTVQDLMHLHLPAILKLRASEIRYGTDTGPLEGGASLSGLGEHPNLWFLFLGTSAIQYTCVCPQKKHTIRAERDMTVYDVKLLLLQRSGKTRTLPGIVSMMFCGTELADDTPILSYGIPPESEIHVNFQQFFPLYIRDEAGQVRGYNYSQGDSINDLKRLICAEAEAPPGSWGIFDGEVEIDGSHLISLHKDRQLRFARSHVHLVLRTGTQETPLELHHSMTVGTALDFLAGKLQKPANCIQFFVDGVAVADMQRKISSLTGTIVVNVVDETGPARGGCRANFVYENRSYPLDITVDTPFSEVKPLLAREMGVPVERIMIYYGRSECDNEMTIEDLDYATELSVLLQLAPRPVLAPRATAAAAPPFPVSSAPAPAAPPFPVSTAPAPAAPPFPVSSAPLSAALPVPALSAPLPAALPARASNAPAITGPLVPVARAGGVEKTYSVMLSIAVIPRVRKFQLGPGATAKDVLDAAVKYWGLQGINLEVAVTDLDEETSTLVPLDMPVDKLPLSYPRTLAVCPEGTAEPAPVATSTRDSTMRRNSRRQSVRRAPDPKPAASAPGEAEYSFLVQDRKAPLLIGFGPTATVKDAKAKVAQNLRLPGPDYVTLFFAGKALKETFVLNRLRIGKQSITVYVRDTTELMIVTALAMRD